MVDPYYDEDHPIIAELRKENAEYLAENKILSIQVSDGLAEMIGLVRSEADLKAENEKWKDLHEPAYKKRLLSLCKSFDDDAHKAQKENKKLKAENEKLDKSFRACFEGQCDLHGEIKKLKAEVAKLEEIADDLAESNGEDLMQGENDG